MKKKIEELGLDPQFVARCRERALEEGRKLKKKLRDERAGSGWRANRRLEI